jgi:hypothetical protein
MTVAMPLAVFPRIIHLRPSPTRNKSPKADNAQRSKCGILYKVTRHNSRELSNLRTRLILSHKNAETQAFVVSRRCEHLFVLLFLGRFMLHSTLSCFAFQFTREIYVFRDAPNSAHDRLAFSQCKLTQKQNREKKLSRRKNKIKK